MELIQSLNLLLSENPNIVEFRWSHAQSWGSSWSFLINFLSAYAAFSIFLHLTLLLIRGRRPVPLGPIPAIHSLSMALISAVIFAGTLSSASAEIRHTRWLWGRSKTPIEWLICFPLGTRPSGRVFFWSYAFYLSRFVQISRTFITILRRRNLSFFHLFNNAALVVTSFLWLEFSQSLQVVEILFTTLTCIVVYGYRFWTEVGLPAAKFPLVMRCQIMLLSCNAVCHFGVLFLHFRRGGCNGIATWTFNSALNFLILLLFLRSYVNMLSIKRNAAAATAVAVSDESKLLKTKTKAVSGENKLPKTKSRTKK